MGGGEGGALEGKGKIEETRKRDRWPFNLASGSFQRKTEWGLGTRLMFFNTRFSPTSRDSKIQRRDRDKNVA